MDIISSISHPVRIICLPQMHVAPLYRLYSAKIHVFVSGMRGAAFIFTGRGKAGYSDGESLTEGEKKRLRRRMHPQNGGCRLAPRGEQGGRAEQEKNFPGRCRAG